MFETILLRIMFAGAMIVATVAMNTSTNVSREADAAPRAVAVPEPTPAQASMQSPADTPDTTGSAACKRQCYDASGNTPGLAQCNSARDGGHCAMLAFRREKACLDRCGGGN